MAVAALASGWLSLLQPSRTCPAYRRGACVMLEPTRKAFAPSDFPASWPYTLDDFSRLDESADIQFYSSPRFVTHIDDGAIAALTAYYKRELPEGSDLLDMCSSWISHLPDDVTYGKAVGVGMNARELEANPRLTEFVQADLNRQPQLSFPDATFDAVLCAVSIDYLVKPLEILREVHRVLRPGGRAIFSFSDRFFPSKAIKMWLQADDEGRQRITASYFMYAPAGGWTDVTAETLPEAKRVAAPKQEGFLGALLNLDAAISSFISRGDPMFVVSAVKATR
ncbi:hypothetical protein AB1Y20_018086 [Prymnesium parvum]|uniref:Methyltransferase type 11 domain-containing protein n=1 Tax=Prymnesium parvum TaxID=97485 RepID=A0AB34JNU3_PRYPA